MKMLSIVINDMHIQVPEGTTILEASRQVNLKIPTLCHLDLKEFGIKNQNASCRVCVVEVEGRRSLVPSCAEVCTDGMVIRTDTIRAISARRMAVELLLSNHPNDCLVCTKNL
ncbi:MAG: (2Fe-2S)-binding protein, partial [Methanomethylovorans sp.]|nr:(2Fe-2S)-binding protein [Methanomethylovorans sp.]